MSKTIYKDPARFYVYAFLREDDTPYYIGKGTGNRAWVKRRTVPHRPVDTSRISILFENLTETEAFSEERRIIQLHGRKDLGTGILRNLTDGGEGSSGRKHTQESLDKQSAAQTGKRDSAEIRAKKSAAKTGENHPMYGKVPSEETKAKRIATRARNTEARILASQI